MDNDTLATELLREIKASAKRWFLAFCVMVALEVLTIAGFMWYISLPTEDTTITQETNDTGGNNQYIGGDNSGEANN